jgi:hypothetical protein
MIFIKNIYKFYFTIKYMKTTFTIEEIEIVN